MSSFKAVFFDFDGVIGNTMDDNYNAWRYAFSKYDVQIDKTEYFLTEGLNTKKIVEHFYGENGKKEGITNEIVRLKECHYLENNTFCFYEGVESLIQRLKEKSYLLGLVSGANSIRISRFLKGKFLKKVDILITGDMVDNPKPHPEPYLKAAKALSLNPSECIVIENAPLGIESAKKAGMYCIAICSTLEKKFLQKADKIIDEFKDLEGILFNGKKNHENE